MSGDGFGTYESILLDGFGNSKKPKFSFSTGTQLYGTCSILWNNDFYLLGGYYAVFGSLL